MSFTAENKSYMRFRRDGFLLDIFGALCEKLKKYLAALATEQISLRLCMYFLCVLCPKDSASVK